MSVYDVLCPCLEALVERDFRSITWFGPGDPPRDMPAVAQIELPLKPTTHLPRTDGKIKEMRRRYIHREALFHPADSGADLGAGISAAVERFGQPAQTPGILTAAFVCGLQKPESKRKAA